MQYSKCIVFCSQKIVCAVLLAVTVPVETRARVEMTGSVLRKRYRVAFRSVTEEVGSGQHPPIFQLLLEQPTMIATLVIVASQPATPAKTPRESLSAVTSMPHDRDFHLHEGMMISGTNMLPVANETNS